MTGLRYPKWVQGMDRCQVFGQLMSWEELELLVIALTSANPRG